MYAAAADIYMNWRVTDEAQCEQLLARDDFRLYAGVQGSDRWANMCSIVDGICGSGKLFLRSVLFDCILSTVWVHSQADYLQLPAGLETEREVNNIPIYNHL